MEILIIKTLIIVIIVLLLVIVYLHRGNFIKQYEIKKIKKVLEKKNIDNNDSINRVIDLGRDNNILFERVGKLKSNLIKFSKKYEKLCYIKHRESFKDSINKIYNI